MNKTFRILKRPLQLVAVPVLCLLSFLFITRGNKLLHREIAASYEHRGPSQPLEWLTQQLKNNIVQVEPINLYKYGYRIMNDNCGSKDHPNDIVIVVKSSRQNFKDRRWIRQTWGNISLYKNFSVVIVYAVGNSTEDGLQKNIIEEHDSHGDMLQGDFNDNYYNLEAKTHMVLHWLENYCDHFKYALYVDDDIYLSPKNTINYLINADIHSANSTRNANAYTSLKGNVNLFAGCEMPNQAIRFRFSKWHVSNDYFPYEYYPTFIGGAFTIMSRFTVKKLYSASIFTRPFKFDDVWLGMVAYKADIEPTSIPDVSCINGIGGLPRVIRSMMSPENAIAILNFPSSLSIDWFWRKQVAAGYT